MQGAALNVQFRGCCRHVLYRFGGHQDDGRWLVPRFGPFYFVVGFVRHQCGRRKHFSYQVYMIHCQQWGFPSGPGEGGGGGCVFR